MEEKFDLIIFKVTSNYNDIIAHCVSINEDSEDIKLNTVLKWASINLGKNDVLLKDQCSLTFLQDRDSYVLSGINRNWGFPHEYEHLDSKDWIVQVKNTKPDFIERFIFREKAEGVKVNEGVAISTQGVYKEFTIPRQKIIIVKHRY